MFGILSKGLLGLVKVASTIHAVRSYQATPPSETAALKAGLSGLQEYQLI